MGDRKNSGRLFCPGSKLPNIFKPPPQHHVRAAAHTTEAGDDFFLQNPTSLRGHFDSFWWRVINEKSPALEKRRGRDRELGSLPKVHNTKRGGCCSNPQVDFSFTQRRLFNALLRLGISIFVLHRVQKNTNNSIKHRQTRYAIPLCKAAGHHLKTC